MKKKTIRKSPSKCKIETRKFQILFLLLILCHSSLIAANETILTDSIIPDAVNLGVDTITHIATNDTLQTDSIISDVVIGTPDTVLRPTNYTLPSFKNPVPRYGWAFAYDLTVNSVPWITAGILLRSERQNFRLARNKFLIDFHNTTDNYSQFAPFAISTTLKAVGYEGRSSWGRYLTSTATSYGIMALLVNSIKYTARELRPDGSTSNSFPSGHTATAFTAATILHKEYGTTRSPWFSVAGYALATATGCMRVLNNRHWVSDTFAGAGIGILSTELGYAVGDLIFKDKGIMRKDLAKTPDMMHNPSFFSVTTGIGVNHQSLALPSNDPGFQDAFDGEAPASQLHFSNRTFVGVEGAYFFNPYIGFGGRLRVSSRLIKNWDLFTENPLAELSEFSPLAAQFIEQYALEVESDHLSEFSTDAGLYFNLPLLPYLSLGTKLLIGKEYIHGIDIYATAKGLKKDVNMSYEKVDGHMMLTYEILDDEYGVPSTERYEMRWDYFNMNSENSINIGTGISVTYAYKPFVAWRFFIDYDYREKIYTLNFAPTEFVKAAARHLTFDGRPTNPDRYIHPFTSREKKQMHDFTIGAGFCIVF